MKKLFSLLVASLLMTTVAVAQKDAKYLAGAVPEKDGLVTFTKSFRIPGKSTAEIAQVMQAWSQNLVENSIPAPGNYARIMGMEQDSIVLRACEWVVFKKKPLNLDRTRMRYQLKVTIDGDRVTMTANQIVYYYGEDMEGYKGQLIKAEEWISDKEAINKAGTKLYPKSGKFRIKTVDYMNQLAESAIMQFEPKEEEIEVKPKHRNVVVD